MKPLLESMIPSDWNGWTPAPRVKIYDRREPHCKHARQYVAAGGQVRWRCEHSRAPA